MKQDLRFAFRQLRKSPGFTSVALLALALGIGANTAVFSIVEGVMLGPLHYREPERLAMIWGTNPRFPRVWNSYPNFEDWQRSSHCFEQMAALREQGVDLTYPGTPAHLKAGQISGGFFSTLGVPLHLGREFTAQENQQRGAPVAVISNRLWQQRFEESSEALDRTITLDGVNYSIVGIAPANFYFENEVDVYTPLGQLDPLIIENRAAHDGIFTVARLKAGVSISQSQAEMSSIQGQLDRLYPSENRDLGIYVEPLKQAIVGNIGQTLFFLLGAVCLVLLVACANVSSLILARSAARKREFAIRTALGASRSRLARQVLAENLLLSVAGAGLGIAIAFLAIQFVLPAFPGVLPRTQDVAVNIPVLVYTLALSLLVGIISGLVPAFKTSNAGPQISLKEGGRGTTHVSRRAQSSFLFIQVGLTLVLLVGAGLLSRTIIKLWGVNPGFDTQNIITLKVGVSHSLVKTPASIRNAYQQMIERIRRVPGVQAAEFTTAVPLSGEGGYLPFWLNSRKPDSLQAAPRLEPFLTGPDYLRATGIPLLLGRFLSEDDTTKTPCVTVVDTDFADKFFPDRKPLGHTITAGFGSAAFGPCTVVGVVGHVKATSLNDAAQAHQVQAYYSLGQDPDQWVPLNYADATVVIRTSLDAAAIMPAIKAANHQSSDQPIYNVRTMHQIASASMSDERFPMILLGTFAGLSLVLASVGLYGVISFSVAQRVQEIGVRMALGADKGSVVRLFIWQQLRLVLAGIAAGALGALLLTRSLASLSHLLYGVRASDPLTFAFAAFVLVGAAIAASYIPARRAAKVDPMVALRYE
ncbi:MAG: ABC transporter permease [Acidobacteria bacterium]|nr:ABC transporter permease [Acidobacteriota bacterium]